MMTKKCPCGNGNMHVETRLKNTCLKGIDLCVESESFVCPRCGIEAGTPAQASSAQKAMAEAYREKTGLLTGADIRKLRTEKGLSRNQLADLMDVCEASIRRWEDALIQDHVTDKSLRRILC